MEPSWFEFKPVHHFQVEMDKIYFYIEKLTLQMILTRGEDERFVFQVLNLQISDSDFQNPPRFAWDIAMNPDRG